jgi:hypothetical protein
MCNFAKKNVKKGMELTFDYNWIGKMTGWSKVRGCTGEFHK